MIGCVRDVKTGRYSQWSAPRGLQPERAACLAALSKCRTQGHPAAASSAWALGIALLVIWNNTAHCGFKNQSKGNSEALLFAEPALWSCARPSIGTVYLIPESLPGRDQGQMGVTFLVPS